jgi:penicillin-binding protein 1A
LTRHQRQLRKRRRHPGVKKKIGLALTLLFAVGCIAVLAVVGWVLEVAATAPDIKSLKPIDKGASSVIYAADGSRLGYVQSDTIRVPIAWRKMPLLARQATVAIEDRRFYRHGGVDIPGIIRAAMKNVLSGHTIQGGSTITQQLVRALYIQNPKRDIQRKIREAKLASELEQIHSKQWVLWQYLNDVPYGTVGGQSAIGIEAAAEMFFSRHADDLSLSQAALLAGLPKGPSEFSPTRSAGAALQRRNEVLRAMAKSHYITSAEAQQASDEPLGLKLGSVFSKRREPYFFDYVQDELIQRYGVGVYRQGGLKIYTTIDPKMQAQGRAAIQKNLYLPSDPSSAIVSIDPKTGYIRAMASSGSYKDRTFNLAAQGHRQPGSSFKVMVLVTALLEGADPNTTTYVSKPLALNVPGFGIWHVKTYSNSYGGAMNLVQATLKSDNTVYAQLDVDLGPKKVAETAHKLGITTKLDGVPSEGLGGLRLGVSPLEMADAYATLASGGMHSKPEAIKRVVFPGGKQDVLGTPKRNRAIPVGVAAEATKILEMNVQKGTGTAAQIGCPAAGKTGTTDNFNDAWFVGYMPTLASAVWVGYPNALKEMRSVHGISVAGGTIPATIWHDYMAPAHIGCGEFPFINEKMTFSPFFGDHSSTGHAKPGSGDYVPTPGGTPYRGGGGGGTGGGGNGGGNGGTGGNGFDPRLYESPPQQEPGTKTPGGGKGHGHGHGNQTAAPSPGNGSPTSTSLTGTG